MDRAIYRAARCTFLCLAVAAISLFAQASGGTITGNIIDLTGVSVSGVRVSLSGAAIRTATSDNDGIFRFTGLADGSYGVTSQKTGYVLPSRVVTVSGGGDYRLNLTASVPLSASMGGETNGILIRSAQNAAANRASIVRGVGLAPGSIITGLLSNVDFGDLVRATETPLGTTLNGFSAWIEADGEQYPTYPVFTYNNQYATILDSSTPVGRHNLIVRVGTRQSDPFAVNIVPAQLSLFTWDSTGQGRGIFTKADDSLVSANNPLQPGDVFIGWGTGGGAAPTDTEGTLHDKQPSYDSLDVSFGGVRVPAKDLIYSGSAGGFGGGDQVIGYVPEGIPFGCGTPFTIRIVKDGVEGLSNVVSVPTSPDGSPCGDSYGLPADAAAKMPGYRDFRYFLTEILSQTSPDVAPVSRLQSTLSVRDLDEFTYVPPNPLNTCSYVWRPVEYQGTNTSPFVYGYLSAALPGFTIVLTPNDNLGAFNALFSGLSNDMFNAGPYTISTAQFLINYAVFVASWQGNYTRAAGNLQQSTGGELSATYASQNGFISPDQAFDIVRKAALPSSNLAVEYRLEVKAGYTGSHVMSCTFGLDDATDPEAARLAIRQQSWPILSTFLPDFFETAGITIRTFPIDPPGAASKTTSWIRPRKSSPPQPCSSRRPTPSGPPSRTAKPSPPAPEASAATPSGRNVSLPVCCWLSG